MVGAGFSRNAEKVSTGVADFPLWWDVASRLYRELYPGKDLGFGADVLRLGQEYKETYGQTALDDLIVDAIPDGKYAPGELHEMLLKLPWADVFTTNYDTLLERTRVKVDEIKYDLVLTEADIARAERPRIVKLHGSFPSQRPFVFTTEDYRRYPTERAPLVNMVQQSIMENAFCLIGFSGDDANFLQWAGWVRDQLGPFAQRMYLCGVLDLNASRRRYFESTQIIPVDIGPLFPEATLGAKRHEIGARWLLESLANGRPADRSRWPDRGEPRPVLPDQRLGPPPLSPLPELVVRPAPPTPDGKKVDVDHLRQLMKSWRADRESYPGWIVVPEPNRASLWYGTDPWLYRRLSDDSIAAALSTVDPSERIDMLYEIAWRARRNLVPLPSYCAAAIGDALEKLGLPPTLSGSHAPGPKPGGGWEKLTHQWVELASAMVNDAWQEQNEEQYERWMKPLQAAAKLKPEWLAGWSFARCWHALMRLDEEGTRAALRDWPMNEGLPFWEAKRAAVLAELGDVHAAIPIVQAALERVRRATDTSRVDHRSLSEEGWLVDLSRILLQERRWSRAWEEDAQRSASDDGSTWVDEYSNRLRELHRYRCDPNDDREQREQKLHESPPRATKRRRLGFDPGTVSEGMHFRAWTGDEWVLLQTFHDGVWPLRCGSSTIAGEELAECARRVWQTSPHLAVAIAIRAGQAKALDDFLDRVDLVGIDSALAQSLYDWLGQVLRGAMKIRAGVKNLATLHRSMHRRLLEGCPRVLSRLTVRLSAERLQDAFDVAMLMYEHEAFREDHGLHEHVRDMFRRVMFSAPPDTLVAWLPRLARLPIPGYENFDVAALQRWPEPTEQVRWEPRPQVVTSELERQSDEVARLCRAIQEGSGDARKRASTRVVAMHWAGMLTNAQMKTYVGALWSKTDATGFPMDPGFAPWFLLKLPERRQGEAREAVARFFVKSDISTVRYYMHWLWGATAKDWENEEDRLARIDWTTAEAEAFFYKIVAWRRSKLSTMHDARPQSKPGPLARDAQRRGGRHLVRVIADVCIRYLANASDAVRSDIREFVSDLDASGISILTMDPAMLMLDPSRKQEAARRIRSSILGAEEAEIAEGCEALFSWLALAAAKRVDAPPSDLLDNLISGILMRRQPGLSVALQQTQLIIQRLPDSLTPRHLDDLACALGYLQNETSVASGGGEANPRDELPLTPAERVDIRGEAAPLAAELARYYRSRALPLPAEIDAWRAVSVGDPLPEVRWAWLGIP
jgi:hypothetical protein